MIGTKIQRKRDIVWRRERRDALSDREAESVKGNEKEKKCIHMTQEKKNKTKKVFWWMKWMISWRYGEKD